MYKPVRAILKILGGLCALYLLLLIPDSNSSSIIKGNQKPFAWRQDSLWKNLESEFLKNKQLSPQQLAHKCDSLYNIGSAYCLQMQKPLNVADTVFDNSLNNIFLYSAAAAATNHDVLRLENLYFTTRGLVKLQSLHWNINEREVRNRLYKSLYGMRAAVEEAELQSSVYLPESGTYSQEHSATPATKIFGINVHSGDLLVSRGGAEVSAFISRGNDYPGNFSHVALIYIGEKSGTPYLIEAHIEKGVAISSLQQYIADKKLRFMVLRPRFNLEALLKDSMLPQKAASLAYDEAEKRHIPYDFKMNYFDSTAMFCSEVGSYAYKKSGVELWKPVSTISSPGIINWLNAFGVEHFVTQMPSDLEYDPQLVVAGEWKDSETLYKDHLYNATMDALITEADNGATIKYNKWLLPIARCMKAYGSIQNALGYPSKIPEGMSATQALKNERFVEMFQQVREMLQKDAELFFAEKKYRAPYWQLVKMAEVRAAQVVK